MAQKLYLPIPANLEAGTQINGSLQKPRTNAAGSTVYDDMGQLRIDVECPPGSMKLAVHLNGNRIGEVSLGIPSN